MKAKNVSTLGLLMLALAAPTRAAETHAPSSNTAVSASPPAAGAHVPRGAALGSRAEEQAYAQREATSPEAKKFKGGDVIVISVTTLAVVLLVVILLIVIL